MTCYIDTSAFLAVIDADDLNHPRALKHWNMLLDGTSILLTSEPVIVETLALLQSRLGMAAARDFIESVIPILSIQFPSKDIFDASISAFVVASQRKLSFVDCTSFTVMRKNGITDAFTFDTHFKEQGFNAAP